MKRFSNYFLRGLMTLLPFGLTVLILFQFLAWSDGLAKSIISAVSPELYFPGLGLFFGVLLICVLGYMTTLKFTDKIILMLELPFKNVPIVKSIYSAIKSLSDYFSSGDGKPEQQTVIVRIPGFQAELVGLVTRAHLNDLPAQFTKENRVAVFVPLSYMVGGMTVFVPRSWVTPLSMSVEHVMTSALTAWMPNSEKKNHHSDF